VYTAAIEFDPVAFGVAEPDGVKTGPGEVFLGKDERLYGGGVADDHYRLSIVFASDPVDLVTYPFGQRVGVLGEADPVGIRGPAEGLARIPQRDEIVRGPLPETGHLGLAQPLSRHDLGPGRELGGDEFGGLPGSLEGAAVDGRDLLSVERTTDAPGLADPFGGEAEPREVAIDEAAGIVDPGVADEIDRCSHNNPAPVFISIL
jgi:hypothetical protein